MEPLISLVAPVYKIKEEYLRQSIESMIGQTYPNIEIILVDDGSPDNCGEICDEYMEKDPRVRVIHQKNQGVSVARNTGMDHAKGEYLMFIDPDDWLELDCCERVLDAMREHKCEVLLFGRYFEDKTTIIKEARDTGMLSAEEMQKVRLNGLIAADDIGLSFSVSRVPYCRLFPREFLVKHALRFTPGVKRGQDNVFNLYLFEVAEKVYYLNYLGYHYRAWEGSVSTRYNKSALENIQKLSYAFDEFISQYHEGDDSYYRAMGIRCYNLISDLEHLILFHEESKLKKNDCVCIIKEYLEDETIKKYCGVCRLADFDLLRYKVRFFLLSRGWYDLYYWTAKLFFALKSL